MLYYETADEESERLTRCALLGGTFCRGSSRKGER